MVPLTLLQLLFHIHAHCINWHLPGKHRFSESLYLSALSVTDGLNVKQDNTLYICSMLQISHLCDDMQIRTTTFIAHHQPAEPVTFSELVQYVTAY